MLTKVVERFGREHTAIESLKALLLSDVFLQSNVFHVETQGKAAPELVHADFEERCIHRVKFAQQVLLHFVEPAKKLMQLRVRAKIYKEMSMAFTIFMDPMYCMSDV